MELHSAGIDFTVSPGLFADLQNRDDRYLRSVTGRLLRPYRFPFVFFLTCDRAEVLADGVPAIGALERALSLNPAETSGCRYAVAGDPAYRLFLLSSGILSPLFGEDTIQGQLLKGLEAARLMGSASPELDKLVLMAVAFSKRIHSEMKVRLFDSTIVDEVCRRLRGKGSVLIVGTGEAARTIAARLCGSCRTMITLRDMDKTFLIPPGSIAVPYEGRLSAAMRADAVVSASSGLYHTFSEEDLPALRGKLLFDLAEPEDMPRSSGAIRIGDLGVELPERDAVVARVKAEAADEYGKYLAWLSRRDASASAEESAERIAFSALRRFSSPIARLGLGADDEKAFRQSLADTIRKAVIEERMSRRS